MANEINYEIRGDGILFYLRDGINALIAYRTTVKHRVELWKEDLLLPPDVGDVSNASFRKRLAKAASEIFGETPHLEEDLGRVAVVLEKKVESEDDETNGKTLGDLLKGMFGPSVTQLLVQYGSEAELFHDPEGEPYATVEVAGHRETWPLKSRGFKNWLRHRYYTAQKEEGSEDGPCAPRAQALNDALAQLEAKCQFEGPEHPVHVRVAESGGAIYIDLADEEWRAIEVTANGWRVVSDSLVKFRRARGMLPLPVPTKNGDATKLRRLVNLKDNDHDGWRLLLAWLVQALRARGPYPVLILQGEQGSVKSTIERLLRALVDSSTAPLRTTPRNEHDLYIAATSAWVVAFDNISNLQPWLSDALCRLSTGGGFSTRTLYENREQELFDAMRPVILNGISDVATRPDLLDRAIVLTLPPIPEEDRKPESEVWKLFDQERSAIFGALLDAVSTALRELPDTKLSSMPRMADFALWATAAEGAFGWESGTFMKAYAGNRKEANELALETDPVAGAVLKLMGSRDEWSGNATELWKALGDEVDEDVKKTKAWPAAPHTLTGRLKRLAPALRKAGIEYQEDRIGHKGTKVKRLIKLPAKERQQRQQRQQGEKDLQNEGIDADPSADAPGHADASADPSKNGKRQQEMPANEGISTSADAAGALLREVEYQENCLVTSGRSAVEYTYVTTDAGVSEAVTNLAEATSLGIDFETVSTDPRKGRLRLVQVSDGKKTYVVDCFAVDPRPLLEALVDKTLIAHHALYELSWLKVLYGFEPPDVRDTMLMSQVLHAGGKETRINKDGKEYETDVEHGLGSVAYRVLGISLDKDMQASDWSSPELSLRQIEYAATDASVLIPLDRKLSERLGEEL